MSAEFSKVEDAISALTEGRIVIVVDDEDRENEGDFVAAAEKTTPEMIAFMSEQGRGLVCVPILPDHARRLDLPLMVDHNTDTRRTQFTVTVDRRGQQSGITAQERAETISGHRRSLHQAGRPQPARAYSPLDREGRRGAASGRSHRSRHRPHHARWLGTSGGDLRDPAWNR